MFLHKDYFFKCFLQVSFTFKESGGNYSERERSQYTHTCVHPGILITSQCTDMNFYLQGDKEATMVLV